MFTYIPVKNDAKFLSGWSFFSHIPFPAEKGAIPRVIHPVSLPGKNLPPGASGFPPILFSDSSGTLVDSSGICLCGVSSDVLQVNRNR